MNLLPFCEPLAGAIPLDDLTAYFGNGAEVKMLRLDILHPEVSGNKWFKLRYYLQQAASTGQAILTFGGPWSNHILATAAACQSAGIASIGIISGEPPAAPSPILKRSAELGMQLQFLPRSLYRQLTQTSGRPAFTGREGGDNDWIMQAPESIKRLMQPGVMPVPAGGYGISGAAGAATILDHCDYPFTHLVAAAGTGTMLAGLINASQPAQQIIGIPVLKHGGSLLTAIQELLTRPHDNWHLEDGYHDGGYARHSPQLLRFMNHFYEKTTVPLDFVYTGKMMLGLQQLLGLGTFPPGARILAIHSGGLAGNQGLPKGSLMW